MLFLDFKKKEGFGELTFSLSFQIPKKPGFHPSRRVCNTHFTWINREIPAYKRQRLLR